MNHKSFFIDVNILLRAGIRITKVVQDAGQVVFTLPKAAHQGIGCETQRFNRLLLADAERISGFNVGAGVSEAVNFALDSWFKVVQHAKYCKCNPASVRFNPKALCSKLRKWKRVSASFVRIFVV
jgi:hypothetical protein